MAYKDGKETSLNAEGKTDTFLTENGFTITPESQTSRRAYRIITHEDYPNRSAKIRIKGCGQTAPRWFQLLVSAKDLQKAWAQKEDLQLLWQQKIKDFDFWFLVSIPEDEIWVFPSKVVFEIAEINAFYQKNRPDNQYDHPYNKKGKIIPKHKELNLDLEMKRGKHLMPIWQRMLKYERNADVLHAFLFSGYPHCFDMPCYDIFMNQSTA